MANPFDKPIAHLDFETRSEKDLPKVGGSRYSRDESTDPLMLAFEVDEEPIAQWVPAIGEPIPKILTREILPDPGIIKAAWNAAFEIDIFQNCLGIECDLSQWVDPMSLAFSLALPGSLGKCGQVVRLPQAMQKDSEGKNLINWFCKPRRQTKNKPWKWNTWRNSPEKWGRYLYYNRQDVVSEREIFKRLMKYMMSEWEWDMWRLDRKINQRGLPINRVAVRNALIIVEELTKRKLGRMKEITDLGNPNSATQLLPWLQAHGYTFEDMKKGHVEQARDKIYARLDETGNDGADIEEFGPLLEVLELRLEVSKASVKKYAALERATDDDDHLRNTLQYAAAGRTSRWGGRIFQPQNLPRPHRDYEKIIDASARQVEQLTPDMAEFLHPLPFEWLSSCVRPMFKAPPGKKLIDADLNAIENRVLGWIADCRKILRVFHEGRCPYIDFGTYMFHEDYDVLWAEYKDGNKDRRTIAKPAVLGCLAAETPVLTDKGWKALIELRHDDWLHDGETWVRHDGVVYKGEQETVSLSGLYATLDHRFLTETGWEKACQLEGQPRMLESALGMGNGVFSNTPDRPGAPENSIFAAANVVENERFPDPTSLAGYPRAAPDALRLTVAPTSGSGLAETFSTPSQIVSTLRARVAKTQPRALTRTTEGAEFVWGSKAPSSGLNTSSMCSEPTARWRSTGWTTTGTTNPEISGSQPGQNRTVTSAVWDILNSGAYARFAVLTDDGCLVAHNCGYMLSAGKEKENWKTGEIEATGLLGYARNMGIDMTNDQTELAVQVFRDTYDEVVDFWHRIDWNVRKVILSGKPVDYMMFRIDVKGPFLRIRLPSGRHLHYCRPSIKPKKMPWGQIKDSICYEGLNDSNQWVELTTHPGKLTENCFNADTLILTDNGVKRIVDVSATDLVWDGFAWVSHNGVAHSGTQETISLGGARVTPEHRIEVEKRWRQAGSISADAAASSFQRHYGRTLGHALRERAVGHGRAGAAVADIVRLRVGGSDARVRVYEKAAAILRVQPGGFDSGQSHDPRDEPSPGVSRLAVDGGSMSEPEASGVQELRGPGDHGMPGVGGIVPELLDFDGADVPRGTVAGSPEQPKGVHPRELRVAGRQSAMPQQAEQPASGHASRKDDDSGRGRPFGDRKDDATVPGECPVSAREDVRPTRYAESVYDLTDCGPRRAFTVVLPDGRFLLAHNCDQAISRDLLAHGLRLADEEGIDTRLHVHDQIVAVCDEDKAEDELLVLRQCMAEQPAWAEGLPLAAEGFICDMFQKD